MKSDNFSTPILVTVTPIPPDGEGGAEINLAPHLRAIGEQVGVALDAFRERFAAVTDSAVPSDVKLRLRFGLEGTSNWVLVGAKATASVEVEFGWSAERGK